MALTSYADLQAMKTLFVGGAAAAPATLYFGLSTSTIAIDGTGITEPSTAGTAYGRVAMTNNATNFTVSTIAVGSGGGAQVVNAQPITFAQSTASWGTVTYWFASDASTGGNIIAYGLLSSSQVVSASNTLSFASGALTIQDV